MSFMLRQLLCLVNDNKIYMPFLQISCGAKGGKELPYKTA